MAHAIDFKVLPPLLEAFNAANCRALKVRIENEAFALAKEVPTMQGADPQTEFARMKAECIVAQEACFVLYVDADTAWNLFSFVPDDAPVRDKMLYSSSRAVLLKALGGGERVPKSEQWTEIDDVVLTVSKSDEARRAEERSVMTEVEKMKIDADVLSAKEAAGSRLSSAAGLSFPMTAEAQASLEGFKAGTLGALVLAIEGETVVQRASAPSATPSCDEMRALLPAATPCYVLYRWAHSKPDGSTADPPAVLFLYVCPEESPVRSKMLHASTKGPFITSITSGGGLEIAKSIEGLEASELTDPELRSQLYAAEAAAAAAAAPTITKAAPRGGRKLVSRNRAAPTPEIS
jgi:twinfilin